MTLYAALDVALEKTALCIIDRDGAVVLEANVATDPDALADRLAPFRATLARLGLEAGPLSEWLVRGLDRRGFEAVLMETRHVRAALSARVAKTDRNDARGMADLLRMGGAGQRFRRRSRLEWPAEGGSGRYTSRAWMPVSTVHC